jgi:cytochrome P450
MMLDSYGRIMGQGLLLTEGELWKKHRRVVSFAFLNDYLKKMVPFIVETANEHFDDIDSLVKRNPKT